MPRNTDKTPRPRDPQNFTRGDRLAVSIFVSIGLAVTVALLVLFVVAVVLPAQSGS